ncbi:DUF4227 family protein [Dethiobacter alkaliphilus]|uniref:Uncharacterized protein n=1 Tax=Dethiobacter alkaliphilus AHT 1 TaxID=555088 RepID=C0GE04_DETAL|nr:DUF4227 family protein [Dethiobacter alkaliphilus]EEG78298.1 hypothetical protein DealDRAFT_0713 [Dethiobacter alkaliphilus AHT 1]
MIIVLGKKVYRLAVVILLLLLLLPLIHYYALRVIEPQAVHYQKPRGEALKVSAETEENGQLSRTIPRFLQYVHEFYQNGL